MEADTSRKFSPSKLATYQDCPRRYQYRYVDKIRRETQSVEAFLGSCVHAALEGLYRDLQHGKTLSIEETIKLFESEWDREYSELVIVREKGYSLEDYRNVGRECLRSYYARHQPFTQDKTVEVEKRVGFPLEAAGESCLIEGFVDRLSLGPDGAFEIHDYKTGKTLPAQQELDSDWQLPIYELAVRHAWPDTREVRLLWHYLRHGKTLVSRRSPEALEALKGEIAQLIAAIKKDHEFAPRKSALCDWCEYRDICPLWSHSEEVSRMPAEQAREDEGVSLVDALAAVEAKKRGLREGLREAERDQKALEAALIRFAEAKGLMSVAGLEGDATIVEREEYRFPTKTHSPEALDALEKELKDSPIWDEVSHLDAHRLLDGYKRKEWPASVLELVEALLSRYVKRSRDKSVRFRRKREIEEQ